MRPTVRRPSRPVLEPWGPWPETVAERTVADGDNPININIISTLLKTNINGHWPVTLWLLLVSTLFHYSTWQLLWILSYLPQWQMVYLGRRHDLKLLWEMPFLTRLKPLYRDSRFDFFLSRKQNFLLPPQKCGDSWKSNFLQRLLNRQKLTSHEFWSNTQQCQYCLNQASSKQRVKNLADKLSSFCQ